MLTVKQPKIITQQPKTIANPNVTDIESVTIEHPKTFPKLSRPMRQAGGIYPLQVVGVSKNLTSPL